MHLNLKDTSKTDFRLTVLISGLIGAVLFILVFGINKLDFTYVDWLTLPGNIDLPQHYLGWVHYRNSPWHFPLGLVDGIIYPRKISVIYTDSIPLFAFIFKLLSPILPESFQYFGLFGIICYILQGNFAGALLYRFSNDKKFSIICSAFFSGSLLMLWRMFYHTSLAAHWIILASIYLWLYADKNMSYPKRLICWCALSITAMTTAVYLVPMVWGIMICCFIGCFLRKHWKDELKIIITSASLTILVAWAFGIFYGNYPSSGGGLGTFSFNLNGFINSQGCSSFLPELDCTIDECEALCYLGLGMIIVIISDIIMYIIGRHSGNPPFFKLIPREKLIPIIVFFAGFFMVSMGNTIKLGFNVFTIPLPENVIDILSIFRANGRFIWPVYYLIILISLLSFHRHISAESKKTFIILALLVLQLFDFAPVVYWKVKSLYTTEKIKYESSLTDTAWQEISDKYSHIVFCPNVYNLNYNSVGYEFQIYAIDNNMTLNCVYLPRDISDMINTETRESFGNNDDAVYIFISSLPESDYDLHYYILDDFIVAVPDKLESAEEVDFTNLDLTQTRWFTENCILEY